MAETRSSPLIAALRLFANRGTELVAPPGSEAGLALLVALGGWQVGLAMPVHLALVRLVRELLTHGPAALASAVEGLQPPSWRLVAISLALGLSVVALSGGWIRAALAIAEDRELADDTWTEGLDSTARVLGWNAATLSWIVAVGVLIGQLGLFAIHGGVAAASADNRTVPSFMGIAGVAIWAFGLGAAVYYLAVSCLGAVVAVAEPRRPFWTLFRRAPAVFLAGGGWQGMRDVVLLLVGWWAAKGLVGQFLIAPGLVRYGAPASLYGAGAALVDAGLALGDAMVLLLVILMGAVVYQRGKDSVAPVPKKNSSGRQAL